MSEAVRAPDVLAERPRPAGTADAPALRSFVLAGRFFAERWARQEAALDGLLANERAPLATWFGARLAQRLAGDPDALRAALDRDVAAIDALLAAQLDAILHHARLRKLEGLWRGVDWLLRGIEPGSRVRVRLLDVSWPEICRDLDRAAEFDQSHLFRKVYEEEFGSPGGEPYGLLLVDHEVRHRPSAGAPTDDVTALKQLAGIAAAAFAPTILSVSPSVLEVSDWSELAIVQDPAAPLRSADFARWRSLGGNEDIRFVGLVLPRVLAREPWHDDPGRWDRFRYAEHAPDAACRVWMSAGFAFASTVVRAFAQFGWPADVRGVTIDRATGGLVSDLPVEPFRTDPGHVWVRPALEIAFTDRQERSLVDAGLMPLSALPHSEEAVFGAVRSLQMPQQFGGPNAAVARANARLSAQINSMLCVSRFAHYIKMHGRRMVGSMRTPEDVQRELQTWLVGYVDSNATSGGDSRARYPLVSGSIKVTEAEGKPGTYGCVIHLQPHYQLDDVSATFRLVTEIVAPGSRR